MGHIRRKLFLLRCTIAVFLLFLCLAIEDTEAVPLKLRRQKLKFGRMLTRTINNAMYGVFDIFAG
uniref:Uncharacterized protein n=1 Tax=Anopheles albimanus TaxID=7167 RepID=A0A182FD06_ANOAL